MLSLALSLKSEKEKEYMSGAPYANIVGSIIYVIICTHSNISHVVSVVNRFMRNPDKVY
jgi:hypothetical protein